MASALTIEMQERTFHFTMQQNSLYQFDYPFFSIR